MLMRNVTRLDRDPQLQVRWRSAVRRWAERFSEFGAQIRSDLEGRILGSKYKPSHEQVVNVEWAQYYLDNMQPFWGLQWELRSVPDLGANTGKTREQVVQETRQNSYFDKYDDYALDRMVDDWISRGVVQTKEDAEKKRWANYEEELRKWSSRVKSKGRAAWKYLSELSDWSMRGGSFGGGAEPLVVVEPSIEDVSLEGFRVQFVGFPEAGAMTQSYLDSFKAGLAFYRGRAGKVFPWLIRSQLPLVVEWEGRNGSSDAAATYERDHIIVRYFGATSEPRSLAHVLAHEMGHHAWRTYLSSAQQESWETFIKGDYEQLDLRDVLGRMRPGEDLFDFGRRIEEEDPILHLQVETLYHNPTYRGYDIIGMSSIKRHLDAGKDPIVHVPANPITGYAAKSKEEAFCEAFGKVVAYGPRAVPEPVTWMLRHILPNLRVASVKDQTG